MASNNCSMRLSYHIYNYTSNKLTQSNPAITVKSIFAFVVVVIFLFRLPISRAEGKSFACSQRLDNRQHLIVGSSVSESSIVCNWLGPSSQQRTWWCVCVCFVFSSASSIRRVVGTLTGDVISARDDDANHFVDGDPALGIYKPFGWFVSSWLEWLYPNFLRVYLAKRLPTN